MHNFKKLEVWKRSVGLAVKIYTLTKTLDNSDQYIFSTQLNRCSVSIPSNVAEGSGKRTIKDFCNYLSIALGSAFELETQLIILSEIHQSRSSEINFLLEEVIEIQKMIYVLRMNTN